MNKVSWSGGTIGDQNGRCFIVAEAGTAHRGDKEKAYALADAAKRAGADCVKFQIVFADEIVHPAAGSIPLPGGDVPIYQQFKQLEKDFDFYEDIQKYCSTKGILFLCSVFGEKSASLYQRLQPWAVKIASPELNHYPLLEQVSGWHCPVLLSTGVSTLEDIKKALVVVKKNVLLFHCITSYPAREEEYNIRVVSKLRSIFGIPVGVSDHSNDPLLVPGCAVLENAAAIEKHLTLSRKNSGLDDPIALEETDFKTMVEGIRYLESMEPAAARHFLNQRYGEQRVEAVMGTGEKHLAPGEAANYTTTKRSIMAISDIQAGELILPQNIALLRSEKNIAPGLSPDNFKHIIGKRAQKKIHSGKGIDWEDIVS
ncbi:MAG: N-acetylneuraminate synthase family protein [Spirochaetales bacterium]|nr:N-acetylneuraminate synthase family protein [Spirochaetales bacterium]